MLAPQGRRQLLFPILFMNLLGEEPLRTVRPCHTGLGYNSLNGTLYFVLKAVLYGFGKQWMRCLGFRHLNILQRLR